MRRISTLLLRLASTTGMSPQNSQMIWRQAPHGGVSVSVSVTTAMESKLSSPSLMALKMATRSAQRVRPYVAFSMLQPVKIFPEEECSAAPTLKLENLAWAFSRPLVAAVMRASYSDIGPPGKSNFVTNYRAATICGITARIKPMNWDFTLSACARTSLGLSGWWSAPAAAVGVQGMTGGRGA